ncbi:hypothetical protein Cgig2_000441 [Carnegiea gigantea]|uniref:Uncharacterized protein n=1 Tax=Carnegiea gigantea TaxID=171969 RepID=A0A9Q1GPK1_9CARY|nr:hypothetical protein Cgig2_000441 [Carnegiea gigantea]
MYFVFSSSETINIGLSGLAELRINEILILPRTQRALSLGQDKSCAGEMLKGCSMLLNASNDVKEIVFQQSETTRGLQSAPTIGQDILRIQRDVAGGGSGDPTDPTLPSPGMRVHVAPIETKSCLISYEHRSIGQVRTRTWPEMKTIRSNLTRTQTINLLMTSST